MRIVQFAAREDDARWDAYAQPRAGAMTDLSAWRRVAEDAYGLRSWFLAALDGDRVVGGLGLFEVRHAVFGHHLATAAFGNDGGFFYDGEEAKTALLAEAKALADRLDADYLLIRTRGPELEGFRADLRYRSAVIDLTGGRDAVWENTLRAKTRNQIRRGMQEGFTVESGHDRLAAFHEVFHRHMRDLGSPAHSLRFYESIVARLGDRVDFLVVRDGLDLVAGAMLCWVNDTAMNLHTVALQEYNRRCPNYLIYWKMIEASCARGCARVDMGRSEEGGPNHAVKLHWGAEAVALRYSYYLRKSAELPRLDHASPRYRLPIALWRRLPLFVSKRLGPRLIAGLI